MKKMSEVFELPLTCQDESCGTVGSVYGGEKQLILQAQESVKTAGLDRRLIVAARNEKSQHAAHAINHADALADALELMIQHNWHPSQFRREAESVAAKALAAYRGEK